MPATRSRPIVCIASVAALCFTACAEPEALVVAETRPALVVGPCADCGDVTVRPEAATTAHAGSAHAQRTSEHIVAEAEVARAVRARLGDVSIAPPVPGNVNVAAGPCFGCAFGLGSKPERVTDPVPVWPEPGDEWWLGAPLDLIEGALDRAPEPDRRLDPDAQPADALDDVG